MILNLKALVAVGLLAIFALALVSGSIILLGATRQTDGEMVEAAVVESTFASIQNELSSYSPGTTLLEDMTVDGKVFARRVTLENVEGDKLVEVVLEVEEVKDRSVPQIHRTRLVRL